MYVSTSLPPHDVISVYTYSHCNVTRCTDVGMLQITENICYRQAVQDVPNTALEYEIRLRFCGIKYNYPDFEHFNNNLSLFVLHSDSHWHRQ